MSSSIPGSPHPYFDEKAAEREARIKSLFESLDQKGRGYLDAEAILGGFLKLTHLPAHTRYVTDLLAKCDTAQDGIIDYQEFRTYVLEKEKELWELFSKIIRQPTDDNNKGNKTLHKTAEETDYRIHPKDLEIALKEAGIHVTDEDIQNFMHVIDIEGNGYIDFQDWRDFLLLLPQETTLLEIYQYYQSSTQLTHDAEVVIPHTDETAHNAYKYLAAGGIAGAVSRTCTAPFDRLKVYLITQTSIISKKSAPATPSLSTVKNSTASLSSTTAATAKPSQSVLIQGMKNIYKQGGIRGFFVGNGLNVIKIVPESAIKFYVFETTKSILAELTHSPDKNDIPVGARFFAGGVAGLCAQFCIYPVETLKTRIMSSKHMLEEQQHQQQKAATAAAAATSTGSSSQAFKTKQKSIIIDTARNLYKTRGVRGFWPGLTVSLMGVFPYQALDMGIYETLKVTYLQYMNAQKDEEGKSKPPNVLILWACGMVSGSIGATTVYPLNMIRTRLQAQGTPGHPYVYTSALDAAKKTFHADGIRGFYKGLGPTLFKVVPSVSISYAVYEFSKRSLGIS
ncbi:mitochondrial carrier domain-containing protein [Mycotypha africana]|uniref:mitochondrial carrier domain-containing protein n=1 Tax=Mycotypha africana TaxID=64632 RepID=UPI0023003D37|nr:mitochondrial carrier domain-containing protein [Mycotypha africana]KAI8975124.1 mitochondrial carrier domain-containing protein [Mycotypha africana]